MSNLLEVLRKAREVLVTDGWCQNELISSAGAHCAIGALHQAVEYKATVVPCILALRNVMSDPEKYHNGLTKYNDTPGRTKEEILALYDRAIAAEEGA